MADPQVWRNLPAEILYCIVHQTNDGKTLGSWMRTSRALRRAVGSRIWSEVLFSNGSFRWHCRPGRFIRLKIDGMELPLGDDRVKTLYLSCYYARPPKVDNEMAYTIVSEKVHESINRGFRNLSFPRGIVQKRVLWQDFIDRIVRESRLGTLKIRGGTFPPANRMPTVNCPTLQVRPAAGLRLKFEGFALLTSLRCLSISCLLPGEGHGLATAVKRLSNLEVLRVQVATKDYPFYLGQEEVPEISPLDEFLRYVYPCPSQTGHHGFGSGPTYGFLTSLRELGLIDVTSITTKLTSTFFATRVIPHPNLQTLLIDMHCLHLQEHICLSSVLAAYLSPKITHLHISPLEALEALVSTLHPFRNSIQVWNFPAWPFFYDRKSPAGLESVFEDLPCYRQVHLLSGSRRKRDYRFLSCYLFDRSPAPAGWAGLTDHGMMPVIGSWGRGVRHMRVEDVDVNRLIVDRINHAHSSLVDLKVLVIVPRPLPRKSQLQLHPRTVAYSIAAQIVRQRLSSLRVVVVGEYRFWLEFPDLFSKGPRRVWGLLEALGDARQAIDVERCLGRRDWRFLNGENGVEESSMVIRRE